MPASGHRVEGVRNLDDRRISRTRHAIDRAFLDELQRRGYDAISVSDIAREANVGRATFYEHYQSKDDLLRAQLRRLLQQTLLPGAEPGATVDATALFAHVRNLPLLYRHVVGRSATARSNRVLSEAVEERAVALLKEAGAAGVALPPGLPPSAAARVWAATLSALLGWWSEHGFRESVDDMQTMFTVCAVRPHEMKV